MDPFTERKVSFTPEEARAVLEALEDALHRALMFERENRRHLETALEKVRAA
jgi:hypothetical protein